MEQNFGFNYFDVVFGAVLVPLRLCNHCSTLCFFAGPCVLLFVSSSLMLGSNLEANSGVFVRYL